MKDILKFQGKEIQVDNQFPVEKPKPIRWTREEIELLHKLYPEGSVEDLLKAFPGRSIKAIYSKADTTGAVRTKAFVSNVRKVRAENCLNNILTRQKLLTKTVCDTWDLLKKKRYLEALDLLEQTINSPLIKGPR